MFLLSTGSAVYAGSDDASEFLISSLGTRTLDPAAEAWADVVDAMGTPIVDSIRGGSAVMYRPDKIMKLVGRALPDGTSFTRHRCRAEPDLPAVTHVFVLAWENRFAIAWAAW